MQDEIKLESEHIKKAEMNYSKNSITNGSYENSLIKEDEIDVDMNTNENNIYKERQLSILLNVFEKSYSKKFYKELMIDIEEKEDLLYPNSLLSFKIKNIKIKCLLKLLMNEYNNFLQMKNKTFHELDEIIHKIKNEFQKASILMVKTDPFIYETTTQIYCKFLFLLSKISFQKENYIKRLSYITLGINMLKIFFIRKKCASNDKTYIIYCKLLLELINALIGDNNYEQALYYIRLLLQIIEISLKIIYHKNNNKNKNNEKTPVETIKKFIRFTVIAFIYTGCCLEHLDDIIQAFEAYKQSKFFLKKIMGFSSQKFSNVISINNSCSYLAEEVFEKLKLKIIKDKIDSLNRQKILEALKKKEEIKLLQKEKLMKLKFIANGIGVNPFKLEKLENKLNKKNFLSTAINNLETIDNELSSLVFTALNKNKKNKIYSNNHKISQDTKKIMSRYELYNILMSKKFRGFIMKTKKLQFYNPKSTSDSISIIQSHLNKKIKIESNSKTINSRNLFKLSNHSSDNNEKKIIKKKINFFKRKISKFKLNKYNNLNFKFTLTKDKEEENEKNRKKNIYPFFNINITKSKSNKNFNHKLKKKFNFNELEIDFEKKNLDKNLMTKSYLRKYSYYDKLSDKELKYQKELLYLKSDNNLYNSRNNTEEKNGIIGKDDLINISLIVNERAKDEAKLLNEENLIDINLLKDSFGTKQNKISVKMKSAMSSVISKYIKERKSHTENENFLKIVKIKKNNEKKLLNLDYSINIINNNISKIKYLMRKNK